MANRLDIVVFGATGPTGKYTLPHVQKFTNGKNLTWGIAGRSKQKLFEVLAETSQRIGADLSSIPIIIADVNDQESLLQMTAHSRVVINCCGPYALYGDAVIKACIETGTHHLDVSGEPLFIESAPMKYHKAAEEKGVYIISSCGFQSIASDIGVCFLEKNFKGTLNSVETYTSVKERAGEPLPGPKFYYGSWVSTVNVFRIFWQTIFKIYFRSNPLPKLYPKLSLRFPLRRVDSKWAVPSISTDRDIIIRSQRYFYEKERKRPAQVYCYILMESLFTLFKYSLLSFIALILAQFQFGRDLLLQHPKFFSGGLYGHEEPLEQVLERHYFNIIFEGEGWSEKLAEGEDQYKTLPNKKIIGRMSGNNPGYGFTCIAFVLSAIMILTEPKKLPEKGGVYTTAAAFAKTSIIEQLQRNGVAFEIVSNKDL